MQKWPVPPLDELCVAVFIDAIVFMIREADLDVPFVHVIKQCSSGERRARQPS